MKRKAEADYRRQLEDERQRAIIESHWVLKGTEDGDRYGLGKAVMLMFVHKRRTIMNYTAFVVI